MKVLMSAYACEPGRGSEPGAGWAWACAAARDHDVWVLTHVTNATSINAALTQDHRLAHRLHPVYLQNARWARPLRRRGPARFLYYLLWQLTRCRREARRLHEIVGFDVCHHITYAADWMPAGISRLSGVPFVWGPVGGSATTGGARLWAKLGARALLTETLRAAVLGTARQFVGRPLARRAAAVLGQNSDVVAAFAPVPVAVEPNVALNVDAETPNERGSSRTAVYAGRLLAWKGLRLALAALRRPEASRWRLEVYGEGPERRHLEQLVGRWKLSDRVRFHGFRPRAEVLDAIGSADVFMFPSLHDSAGWSVAEAMALGCPVLCLDTGGPPTLVGAEDGVVVPLDSDIVGRLASGLDLARELRPRREQWSARRLPDLLDELYSGLVPGPQPGGGVVTLTARSARARRALGLMSWATADQILFALSNFVITIAVARGMGIEGLGRFSIAFAAYLTVLGFARALISEPLLAQPPREGDRGAEAASVTLTLLCAAAGAIVVGGAGLILGRVELLVVAAALPVILLHDILRYHAFRRKKAQHAALLDGGWLLGSVIAWPVVTSSGSVSVALLCWAGAGLVGIGLGLRHLLPHLVLPSAAMAWWRRDARGLAGPLVLDGIFVTISLQATVFVLASVAGDGALGLLRAGQVYFAPLGMVLTALGVLAVPHLTQRSAPTTNRLAYQLSAGLAALACLICAVIIVAEPLLHAVLYADVIDVPGWLLASLAAQVILSAAAGGMFIVCKVRARGGDLARTRLSSTVIGLAVLVPTTIAFGLQGAAWALVVQSLLYTVGLGLRIARGNVPAANLARLEENRCRRAENARS